MPEGCTIVWFRQDLRVADNPALLAAIDRGRPVVPVFIWAPHEETPWQPGAAKRWWIHHALQDLSESLAQRGVRLVVRQGDSRQILENLTDQTGADAVYWNRRYEPKVIQRDKLIKQSLMQRKITAESFNGHLMYEPWDVQTQAGTPYKVFTPFWRMAQSLVEPDKPLRTPRKIPSPSRLLKSDPIDSLKLLPTLPWANGFKEHWQPTELGAHKRLKAFLKHKLAAYKTGRDFPADQVVSGLSPYLANGQISPRTIWHATKAADLPATQEAETNLRHFQSELGWREFAYHVLYHFPHTPGKPLHAKYGAFPWLKDDAALHQWHTGRTGYPLVDAGMRELWGTGSMHNRVRMVVASFLVKDLLISWEQGARWFWDCLVDADLANNTLGWQWAGGCGADAAPYFRVFNPTTQSKKFDSKGLYIRNWVPELSKLPPEALHEPSIAKPLALVEADVTLDTQASHAAYAHVHTPGVYPEPVVDHGFARGRALEALNAVKTTAQ